MNRKWVLFFTGLCLASSGVAATEDVRFDKVHNVYHFNKDYTYTLESTVDESVLSASGVEMAQKMDTTYFPDRQNLQIENAYVLSPDGEKIPVTDANIFTRPSAASRSAPGFTNSLTTTVVFPRLMPGSKLHVTWKFTQFKPMDYGFTVVYQPEFGFATKAFDADLYFPDSLKMYHSEEKPFTFEEETKEGETHWHFAFQNFPKIEPEVHMISPDDILPNAIVSSHDSWTELAKVFEKVFRKEIHESPELLDLANKITNGKEGLDAVKAIYQWESKHITYISMTMNASDSYTPHSPEEILKNGYGDCKDYVILMASLLKSIGIESYPVLVNWNDSYVKYPIPTPNQFNHAIIYLPQFALYANPTDRFSSLGDLGNALSHKFVLVLANPPYTAMTPPMSSESNKYEINKEIAITHEGDIDGNVNIHFTGIFNSIVRNSMSNVSSTKLFANNVLSETLYGGFGDMTYTNPEDLSANMRIKANWLSKDAITPGDTMYFMTPVGFDFFDASSIRGYLSEGDRKYPLLLRPSTIQWEYTIKIPHHYSVVRTPKNRNITNPVGAYHADYQVDKEHIQVRRVLVISQSIVSPDKYPLFASLARSVLADQHDIFVVSHERSKT